MTLLATAFLVFAALCVPLVIAGLWIEISGLFRDPRELPAPLQESLARKHIYPDTYRRFP
jgi:hypothetical protein